VEERRAAVPAGARGERPEVEARERVPLQPTGLGVREDDQPSAVGGEREVDLVGDRRDDEGGARGGPASAGGAGLKKLSMS